MLKFTSLLTSLGIIIGFIFSIFLPHAPVPVSQDELLAYTDFIEKKELADTIYTVNLSGFSEDERNAVIALQGIVAKTNPCIYLMFGGIYNIYLNDIINSGKKIISTDKDGNRWTLYSLINEFRSYIMDEGFCLYKNSEYAEGMNVATNYATVYGWLPVAESLKDNIESCGLVLKKDLTQEEYNTSFQRKYFNELKKYFNKGKVVHLKKSQFGLRDLAISQNLFCFYSADNGFGENGYFFTREVMRWSGKNTTVLGWCEYEKETVKLLSQTGSNIIAADYCYNCSYLANLDNKNNFNAIQTEASTDAAKHYVTLVFSDGDNCQWLQNGFTEYHTTIQKYRDAKVSWTFSPVLSSLCPPAIDYTLSDSNINSSFICGPSGYGYCNPSRFDAKSLDLFSTQTAASMLKNNQNIITILDDYKPINEAKMLRSFDYFSRFDNINGGILFLDPDRYEAGKGKVWFSNDKPFASVRLSLWAEDGYEGATDEWLYAQAEKINSSPADIRSINGYSVICIHAWSMKPEALNKFINMLDEHIEILSADDFIQTMSVNIPHKTAIPESYN